MEEMMMKQMLEITSKALESVNTKKDVDRIDILTEMLDLLVSSSCKQEYHTRMHEVTDYILSHNILISHYDQNGKFLYLSCNECESDFYIYLRNVFEAIKLDDPLFSLDYLVHDFMVLFNIKDRKYCYNKFCKALHEPMSNTFKEPMEILGLKATFKDEKTDN